MKEVMGWGCWHTVYIPLLDYCTHPSLAVLPLWLSLSLENDPQAVGTTLPQNSCNIILYNIIRLSTSLNYSGSLTN